MYQDDEYFAFKSLRCNINAGIKASQIWFFQFNVHLHFFFAIAFLLRLLCFLVHETTATERQTARQKQVVS